MNEHAPAASPVKVLIVDDQQLMLRALRVFIDAEEDLVVVGEARNGRAAVEQCRALRPDVVVMDLQMPVLDGIEATRAITHEHPEVKVLAVTTFHSEDWVIPALRAGASGYVVKDSEPHEIVGAVRSVLAGEAAISRRVAATLVRSVVADPEPAAPRPEDVAAVEGLSAREREVVALLCEGLSNREIAAALFVSEPTVKSHLSHILTKMEVRDRVQVVIKAYRTGLVTIPSS
ncbi:MULTISPECIES: response regulator [Kocuria]|jgi:DNA-binding NarL/FixJ family response regulator|uniref:LuxR family transcriptional regulator n=1 Tax=Kocuria rosea subsp. polaris TaxID=136273 RepID=A0A0A6YDA0_KOCRO|nr:MULTISPECIES: response regulator transcription factor [Kocuria]MCC5784168.1 DNA-binding response regulator [Kocuria sp. CCUG 69068]KHD98822.1 LuxR family transcriptional regulator [Kocuria polaris]MCM3486319.1 response regulator transcription factor [Kocuria rosea]MEB2529178.1 response regulator transcription factor [Kocuria rosea]MEB2619913.1 response regulator transcription factor [Kocuria rosea]